MVVVKMELQEFKFEGVGVRTTMIDDKPFFCLKDVCEILELEQVSRVVDRLKKDGVTTSKVIDSMGREQQANFINESNLYKTIFQSRKESAEKFQDWVTEEVLPAIRKHGMYATDNFVEKALSDPDYMIEILIKFKEEKKKRIEAERINAILTHVNKTYTATEIAKELNLKSAIELNKKLSELKVQFKQNNTWVMYSKYSDCGYEEIKQEVLDNGRVVYHRKITQLGREFILSLFENKLLKEDKRNI
jgi:prophage antirepressor-like protein